MVAFFSRRFAVLLITLFVASVTVFVVLEILPGDVAQLILGTEARADTLTALRLELGLDRPAVNRYLTWIAGFFSGELGMSYTYDVPVAELISDRLSVTIPLAIFAFILSTLIALPAGMFAAYHHNKAADWGIMTTRQLALAIPNFWFAMLLILVFSIVLGWLPAGGFPGWGSGIFKACQALLLPSLALAFGEMAILARVTRGAVLDTINEDFIRTACAKGLGANSILRRHVLRNALIPITTILGLQFAFLVAGTVVVENVFYLPGLGRLLVQAVHQRDLFVVRDVVLLLTGLVIVVNFIVDGAYAVIDPRPRGEL